MTPVRSPADSADLVGRPAPGPLVLVAIALAGVAAVSLSAGLAVTSDTLVRPGLQAALINWITIPYVLGGLLAWSRRPASRLGLLMIATGLIMALIALQWSSHPTVSAAGHLLDLMPAALFLHVFLAYPDGRLHARAERFLVGACYAVCGALQIAKVLLGVDPADPFAVSSHPNLALRVEQTQLAVVVILLVLGAAALLARTRSSSRPSRRGVQLTVDAFGVALVMLAVLYLAGLRAWPAFEVIRNVTFATLGLAPVAFLLGLLDARLARADVGELVVRLRDDPTGDLQAPLARALHDPTVTIAYWLPHRGSWADPGGHPVTLPTRGDQGRAVRVITHDDRPVAALTFHASLEHEEPELLDSVVAAAAIALENGRLQSELRAQLLELQDSRSRVLEAGRIERQRLERNLHDGAQQRLVALNLELGMLGHDSIDQTAKERLERIRAEVTASLEELRDISRGIYPAVLTGHGLAIALESLAARTALPVHLDVTLTHRLPEAIEAAAYYLVCEALANTGKHAQASRATVHISQTSHTVLVDISDDGQGGADPCGGSGLRGLTDRVEALGGTLELLTATGGGTRIRAQIPNPVRPEPAAGR